MSSVDEQQDTMIIVVSDDDDDEDEDIFEEPLGNLDFISEYSKKNDGAYICLFLITCSIFGVISAAALLSSPTPVWMSPSSHLASLITAALLPPSAALLAAIWLALYFSKMRMKLLQSTVHFSTVTMVSAASLFFVTKSWFIGGLLLTLAILDALWMLRVRERLQFVGIMLELVSDLLQKYSDLKVLAVGTLAVQTIGAAAWSLVFVEAVATAKSVGSSILTFVLLYICLYWFVRICHDTVYAMVVATVVNSYGDNPLPRRSRGKILRSLMCGSATGSLLAGSLFSFAARFVWWLVRGAKKLRRSSQFRQLGGDFSSNLDMGSMAERFVIRNNKYAYAYVALKRTRWTEASEDLWRVFDRRAVHLVLRSDLTDRLLLMWCYASGALNVTLFTPFVWHSSQGDTFWIIISINAFIIGFASIATLSALLEGATDAVYIVFALRPQAISDLLIFHRLSRIAELQTYTNVAQDEWDDFE